MKRTIWIGILLLCIGIGKARAQNDPVLAGMILLYTDKAEKELKKQEKVMLMQTTGHLWTKEEVKATTDLQREFNNYLDSFRSIVCYAAQIYGFYLIACLPCALGKCCRQRFGVAALTGT